MMRSDDDRGDGYDFSAVRGGDAAGEAAGCCEGVLRGVQRSSGMSSWGQGVEIWWSRVRF